MPITVERLQAEVEADTSKAIADLAAFDAALELATRDKKMTVEVDVDNGEQQMHRFITMAEGVGRDIMQGFGTATQAVTGFTSSLGAATNLLSGLGQGVKATEEVGKEVQGTFTSIAASMKDAFSSISGGASGAASAMGPIGAAAGEVAGKIGGMLAQIPQMLMMGVQFAAIGTAAVGALGAIQALTAAVGALAAMVSGPLVSGLAAGALGLGALGGAAVVAYLGLQDVFSATQAMTQAQTASGRSTFTAAQAARDLRSAQMGLADATKAVTRAEEELKRAEEGLNEARQQAARALVEQRRGVRDAIWAEEDAIDRVTRAQENLARAQKNAGKSASQLTKETDDFTGKVYEVARVSSDAVDGVDNVKQAERELIHAQEEAQRATERRKDAQEDLATAEKKGITGSDLYVQATRRLKDAQDGLVRAHDNVAAAQERINRTMEENARRMSGGAAANSALATAMGKLTAEGKSLATFLSKEFLPAWKQVTDAAQAGIAPGVEKGLRNLQKTFPGLSAEVKLWGQALGDAFEGLTSWLSSPQMQRDFKGLSKDFREVMFGTDQAGKHTNGLIDAIKPLGNILIQITKAAMPMMKLFTDDMVKGLNSISKWMDDPKHQKEMENFFLQSYDVLKQWMPLLKELIPLFTSIITAATPLAKDLLADMTGQLQEWNKELATPEGKKRMTDFFNSMHEPIKETFGLVKDLIGILFTPPPGGKESPFTTIVKSLREDVVPALHTLFADLQGQEGVGPAFSTLVVDIANLIHIFTANPKALETGIRLLAAVFDTINFGIDALTGQVHGEHSAIWTIGVDLAYLLLVLSGNPVARASAFVKMKDLIVGAMDGWVARNKTFVGTDLPNFITGVGTAIAGMISVFSPQLGKVFKWFTDTWAQFFRDWANSGSLTTAISQLASRLWNGLKSEFGRALNSVIGWWNTFADWMPDWMNLPQIKWRAPVAFGGGGGGGGGGTQTSGKVGYKPPGNPYGETTYVNPGLRAGGGPVEAGRQYIVGENRPELLTLQPGGGGYISSAVPGNLTQSEGKGISADELDRVLEKVLAQAKPNVDMEVNMTEHVDPKLLADQIAWSIR